jgi:hypothetical protein
LKKKTTTLTNWSCWSRRHSTTSTLTTLKLEERKRRKKKRRRKKRRRKKNRSMFVPNLVNYTSSSYPAH